MSSVPALSTSPTSATSAASLDTNNSVEVCINNYIFCYAHGNEKCVECDVDYIEDNDFTAGQDSKGREPIHVDFTKNQKDGSPQCKKHHSATCTNCFAFKKTIVKGNKDAKNKGKGKKK